MVLYPSLWLYAVVLYVASFAGDLVDGLAARKFNQCSKFGGLLDMVTDRCSTAGLLFVLGCEATVPLHTLAFQALILLDISSHWCQMYASLDQHHKSKDANHNVLVRWYYDYYLFFGYLCVGAEFLYVTQYVLQHMEQQQPSFLYSSVLLLWRVCLPGCILKQIINVAQLQSSCYAVATRDALQHSQDSANSGKES